MGGVNYFIKIPHKLERCREEKFQKTMNNFKKVEKNCKKTVKSSIYVNQSRLYPPQNLADLWFYPSEAQKIQNKIAIR